MCRERARGRGGARVVRGGSCKMRRRMVVKAVHREIVVRVWYKVTKMRMKMACMGQVPESVLGPKRERGGRCFWRAGL